MFLGKQGEYIAMISENRADIEAVADVAGFSDIVETNEPVRRIDNEYLVGADNIAEYIRQRREQEYIKKVDPITSHISRLQMEEQTLDIQKEIDSLVAERTKKIEEIKEQYPY